MTYVKNIGNMPANMLSKCSFFIIMYQFQAPILWEKHSSFQFSLPRTWKCYFHSMLFTEIFHLSNSNSLCLMIYRSWTACKIPHINLSLSFYDQQVSACLFWG